MRLPQKVVLVTGGFDPIHSGHIEYFKAARELGDILVVGLNSDAWLARKKGQPFLPFTERQSIIENLCMVDHCILFNDDDGSAREAIKNVRQMYPHSEIIFANGGDRTKQNIPEMDYPDTNLAFVFGIGGSDKRNSSSWILREWKNPKFNRAWGWYRVLDDKPGYKVKELVIQPGKHLSMQRHFKRSEHWFILSGTCDIIIDNIAFTKSANQTVVINRLDWHQAQNNYDRPCHILEVQYGTECVEEDIERV